MEQQDSAAPTAEGNDSPPVAAQDASVSKDRFDGLMSAMGKRTAERDAARAELERLRAVVASGEGSINLDTPQADEGEGSADLGTPQSVSDIGNDDDEVIEADPMMPPEPPVIRMDVMPARGQSAPIGRKPGASEIEVLRENFAKAAQEEHQRLLEAVRQNS